MTMTGLFILFQSRASWRERGIEAMVEDAVLTLYAILIVLAVIFIIFVLCTTKKADWVSFFTNKPKKVSFLDYQNANKYLELVGSAFENGNEGILFFPIAKHTEIAEKMAVDLYFSGNEDYKRYAASLLGFIEFPKRHLFVRFYRAEKQYYQSLSKGDSRRENSHAVVESLILSTFRRNALTEYGAFHQLGNDWVNFLYEMVNDAIDGYEWRNFEWAFTMLEVCFGDTERFKALSLKYEKIIAQTADKNRQANDKLHNRDMFWEVDQKIEDNTMSTKYVQLSDRMKNLIDDIINFMRKQHKI